MISVDLRRRLYEMLVVYSLPIKAIIHEKVRWNRVLCCVADERLWLTCTVGLNSSEMVS